MSFKDCASKLYVNEGSANCGHNSNWVFNKRW